MSLNVKVYDNGDHTCLVWLPADGKPIADCRGFTIRRKVQGVADAFLHGFSIRMRPGSIRCSASCGGITA
jgi:hypothetical protein